MADLSLLSPTFPSQLTTGGAVNNTSSQGKRLLIRKTIDYHATALRYLENRIWQRDIRDIPIIQPDATYYNDLCIPSGMSHTPVNVVTTKFVKACTNKTRSPIFSTAWVPDGRRLVTGAASGEFTLWNGVNFNFESIIQAHDCSVRSINWSHNGKWMVTTDDRGFIKYWQINFNNVHTYQAHSEPVRSSSFSPTDSKLATCSDDGTVKVFDFLSCREEHVLRGHGADVKCLDWHPRKCLLASGSKDNQQPVKLWDPKMGQSVSTIHAHKATVMDIKWNRNGNWFATASRDFLIKLYDLRTMKEFAVLKGHKKDVNTISWHPIHEKVFASGGSDGAILFWLVGNDREIGGMESAHEGFVWTLSWHPLGHLLCSGANDHTCKFWCRNKPGEELKDKYNSFHNPFFLGEEMEMSNLPGMNIDPMRGPSQMMPPPRDAIKLPPPPSAVSPWRSGPTSNSGASGLHVLPGPRVDVAVLGADIIAETFADKGRGGEMEHQFPHEIQEEFPHPPPPHPLLNDSPHNFHNEHNERGGGGDNRGRWLPFPTFGGPRGPPPDEMGGSRYNWHRMDYPHPRRPSFEEENWNPYVYRREPNGPPPPHRGGPPPHHEPRRPSQDMRGFPDEFSRPPPVDEYGRPLPPPPPPGDRQFLGRSHPPPPGDDRHFPHDRERSFHQDPRQAPSTEPHPPNQRDDYPQGGNQYNHPPPPPSGNDRHFPPPERDRPFPQDPRQAPNEPHQRGGPPPPNDDHNYPSGPPPPPQGNQYNVPPPPNSLNYQPPPLQPPPNLFHSEHYESHNDYPPPPKQQDNNFNNGPHVQDPRQSHNQFPPPPRPSDPRQRGGGPDEHRYPQGRQDSNYSHGPPPPNYRQREYSDHQFDGHYQKSGRGDYQEGGHGSGDPRFDRGNDSRFDHSDPRFERNNDPRFDRGGPPPSGWRDNEHHYDNHDDRRRDQGSIRGKNKDDNSRGGGRHRGGSNVDIIPSSKRPKKEQNEIDSRSSRGHSKNK